MPLGMRTTGPHRAETHGAELGCRTCLDWEEVQSLFPRTGLDVSWASAVVVVVYIFFLWVGKV